MDPSWLYPVLLPRLYPTLFIMYRENHAEGDRKLDGIVERLGTKTEEELARLFGIHRSEKCVCVPGKVCLYCAEGDGLSVTLGSSVL